MREGVVVKPGCRSMPMAPVETGASELLTESARARARAKLHLYGVPSLDAKSGESMKASRTQPTLFDPVDTPAVLCAFFDFSRSYISAVSANLWILDSDRGRTHVIASCDEKGGVIAQQLSDGDIVLEALESGMSILRAAPETSTRGESSGLWQHAIPLGSGTVRGVVTLGIESDNLPEIERFEQAAEHHKMVLLGALAFHCTQAREDSVRALSLGIQELATAVDSESILRVALNHAMALLKGHTGSIMLLDEDRQVLRIAISRGLPQELSSRTTVAVGEGVSGWVAATGKPLVIEDVAKTGRANGGRHGVLIALSSPIMDDSGLIGVINIGRKSQEGFLSHQREHLNMFLTHLATALRVADGSRHSRQTHLTTLKALALALELNYPHAAGGKSRVVEWSSRLGIELGMAPEDLEALEVASVLYDIGIDFSALAGGSGGPLTTYERGLLMMHPLLAAEILEKANVMQAAIPIVLHHHERFDGSGYVGRLAGTEIPLGARILAVTDAFAAMTAHRPYRRAMTSTEVIQELKRCAGTQFDPAIVELFCPMIDTGQASC